MKIEKNLRQSFSACLKKELRLLTRAMAQSNVQSPELEALGSSAQARKVEMHALGDVCAFKARFAVRLSDGSIGQNELFDLECRRQVIIADAQSQIHFLV